MSENKKTDPRSDKLLQIGVHRFNDASGQVKELQVNGVLGYGGSSITYDVTYPEMPTKNYALKEFFPYDFVDYTQREKDDIYINQEFTDEWQKGMRTFLGEKDVYSRLPNSNSKYGNLFLYAVDWFVCNNSAYLLYDTENCKTLKDFSGYDLTQDNIDFGEQINNTYDNLVIYLKYLSDICLGLSALHKNGILHLDVSDTNVMVSQNGAKLTDFGSAVLMEKKNGKYIVPKNLAETHQFTHTYGFSPIEVISASEDGEEIRVNEASDTYSVCAILYKYLFGHKYNSVEDNIQRVYEKINTFLYPVIPNFPKLSQCVTVELIELLNKGLSGNEFRYQTASELYFAILKVLKLIKSEQADSTFYKKLPGFCALILVVCLFVFALVWMTIPPPTISAEIDSIYTKGETIDIDILICDGNNLGAKSVNLDRLKYIKLDGFVTKEVSFLEVPTDEKDVVAYRLSLKNISAEETGKKAISIGKIYKSSPILGKSNKPLKLEFYYGENINCDISAPSVTKVNSNKGHCVEYILKFSSPVDFELDMDSVGLHGFKSENITLKDLGNNIFSLIFENVVGESGADKYFVLYDSTAKDDTIYHSKQIESPPFSIVEEEISNSIIRVNYSIVDSKIEEGGYVILSPNIMNATEYNYNVSSDDIELVGFFAKTKIVGEDIVLYDLKAEDFSRKLCVNIAAGCIVAKNGSTNDYLSCKLESDKLKDEIIPSLALLKITDDNISVNGSAIYKLYIDDNSKYVIYSDNPKEFIELVGFNATVVTTVTGSSCYISFQDIKPIKNCEEFYVIIKEGIVSDLAGNISVQIESKKFNIR